MKVCGDKNCGTSTGMHGGLTHGKGELDDNGFWEIECEPCSKAEAARENAKSKRLTELLNNARPSFSEILNAEKNTRIHRGKALGRMIAELMSEAYDAGRYSR